MVWTTPIREAEFGNYHFALSFQENIGRQKIVNREILKLELERLFQRAELKRDVLNLCSRRIFLHCLKQIPFHMGIMRKHLTKVRPAELCQNVSLPNQNGSNRVIEPAAAAQKLRRKNASSKIILRPRLIKLCLLKLMYRVFCWRF